MRECYTLEQEEDYDLNGDEFAGRDWVEESEPEDYDESFVPVGGFPARPAAQTMAPANGFVPTGPQRFPAEFAEDMSEDKYVCRDTKPQDPWAIDGDPWSGGSSSSASVAPSGNLRV